jgi:hypothetical protein
MQDNRIPCPHRTAELMDAYANCVTAITALALWRSSGNPAAIADAEAAFRSALDNYTAVQEKETPC